MTLAADRARYVANPVEVAAKERRLLDAAAETRAARETAKADGAIAELRALMRLRTRVAALGDGG
jgi:hypothetical protein